MIRGREHRAKRIKMMEAEESDEEVPAHGMVGRPGTHQVMRYYFDYKAHTRGRRRGAVRAEQIDLVSRRIAGSVQIVKLYQDLSTVGCFSPLRFLCCKQVAGRQPGSHAVDPTVEDSNFAWPRVVSQAEYDMKGVPPGRQLDKQMEYVFEHCYNADGDGDHGGLYMKCRTETLRNLARGGKWQLFGALNGAVAGASAIPDELIAYSGAFLVPKSSTVEIDGERLPKMRSIVDGRSGNAWIAEPSNVKIFPIKGLHRVMSNVMQVARSKQAPFYMINADLKHCFFQLPLPQQLAPLLAIRSLLNGYVWLPQVLPMGFTLSPLLAMLAIWGMLLNDQAPGGKPQYVDWDKIKESLQNHMPYMVPFARGDGALLLMVDNIFVITTNKDAADYWSQRIALRTRHYGFHLKDGADCGVITMQVDEVHGRADESPEVIELRCFTGHVIYYDGHRAADRKDGKYTLPNTFADWTPANRENTSYAAHASYLGEINWALTVERELLFDHGEFMRLYRVGSPGQDRAAWKRHVQIDEQHFVVLRRYYEQHVLQRRFVAPLEKWPLHDEPVRVARWIGDAAGQSESHASCCAAVCMTELLPSSGTASLFGTVCGAPRVHQLAPTWESSAGPLPIAARELLSCLLAVRQQEAMYEWHAKLTKAGDKQRWARAANPDVIFYLGDNTTANSHIEVFNSDDPLEREIISEILTITRRRNWQLQAVWIRSEDNLADMPTRVDVVGPGSWRPAEAEQMELESRYQATLKQFNSFEQQVVVCKIEGGGVRRLREGTNPGQ